MAAGLVRSSRPPPSGPVRPTPSRPRPWSWATRTKAAGRISPTSPAPGRVRRVAISGGAAASDDAHRFDGKSGRRDWNACTGRLGAFSTWLDTAPSTTPAAPVGTRRPAPRRVSGMGDRPQTLLHPGRHRTDALVPGARLHQLPPPAAPPRLLTGAPGSQPRRSSSSARRAPSSLPAGRWTTGPGRPSPSVLLRPHARRRVPAKPPIAARPWKTSGTGFP